MTDLTDCSYPTLMPGAVRASRSARMAWIDRNREGLTLALILLGMLALIVLGDAIWGAPAVDLTEAQEYCQMVHDRNWPDFHHVYKLQCLPNGQVNQDYVQGKRP